MRNRLPFLSGLALATLGVSGLAGGGLLWNFQGRTLGLGSTVTALVLLGISFVLLRPEPRLSPVEVPEASQPLKVRAPQASFLGLMLAILGTFGMAGSGLLWNFQGLIDNRKYVKNGVCNILLSFSHFCGIFVRS